MSRGFNITHVYEDVCSGTRERRPELRRLMDDARKRKWDIVLVWRFDRFARSTKHLLNALDEFRTLGIEFISYSENIQTNSPLGEALFSIIGVLSQLEASLIKERVRSGLANAKAKGRKLGRPKKRSDQKIRLLRSKGLSYRAIAKELSISVSSVQAALKTTSSS